MRWFVSALFGLVIAWTATINCIALELVQPTVVYPDQNATFTCDVGGALSAGWKINDTLIDDLPLAVWSDVHTCPKWRCGEYSLTILAKVEYNMTKIQCFAVSKNSAQRDNETAYLIIHVPDDLIHSSSAPTATPTSGGTSTGNRVSTIPQTADLTITPTVPTNDPDSDSTSNLIGILASTLAAAVFIAAVLLIPLGLFGIYKYNNYKKRQSSTKSIEEEGDMNMSDYPKSGHPSSDYSSAEEETSKKTEDSKVTLPSLENGYETPELESTHMYQPTHHKRDPPKPAVTRDNSTVKTSDASHEVQGEDVVISKTPLTGSIPSLYSELSDPDLAGEQVYQDPQVASN